MKIKIEKDFNKKQTKIKYKINKINDKEYQQQIQDYWNYGDDMECFE